MADHINVSAEWLNKCMNELAQVKSVLDEIPGVGPARRKALMRHFQSIEDVKAADAQTLSQVPEIPLHVAEAIVSYFQNDAGMLQ